MEISNSLHANLHKDRKGSFEVDEKRIYMPIYMIMFLENTEINKFVYKLDLSGM